MLSYGKFASVETEYVKNPDVRREDVLKFLDWINRQPHLPEINELEAFLFLQSCYGRAEMAKISLDTYFTVRTMCPEIFSGRSPLLPPIKNFMPVALYTPLPKLTPDGYQILFVKIMDPNPDLYIFNLALRYFDMSTMLHLYQNGSAKGHLIVFDMNNIVFGHVTKLGPLSMKKYLFYLQEAMPVRLKGFHYFNVVPFMDKIMALMRPFLKKELMDVLHLHTSIDGLLDFVPRDCLPKDYGGSIDSLQVLHDREHHRILENADFFQLEDTRSKVDESQRPGKPKNVGDYFGVEGTFKKLDID